MQLATFSDTDLTIISDTQHTFLIPNKDVALGYGTSIKRTFPLFRQETHCLRAKLVFLLLATFSNSPYLAF